MASKYSQINCCNDCVSSIKRSLTLAILPTMLLLAGCSEKQVEVFPVTGKVNFNGQVPVGATVVLHPVDDANQNDFAPTGTVEKDGTFKITSYEPGDGAPAGEYVATIEWYKYDARLNGVGPNVLPKKYSNWKTSPIKVSVAKGPSDLAPITIN